MRNTRAHGAEASVYKMRGKRIKSYFTDLLRPMLMCRRLTMDHCIVPLLLAHIPQHFACSAGCELHTFVGGGILFPFLPSPFSSFTCKFPRGRSGEERKGHHRGSEAGNCARHARSQLNPLRCANRALHCRIRMTSIEFIIFHVCEMGSFVQGW